MACSSTSTPTGMKHLLEDGCAGERPPKRHSTPLTSPPSLPTFSPQVASPRWQQVPPHPAEEEDDCIFVTPRKNISDQYTYFDWQLQQSSPTRKHSSNMGGKFNFYSPLAEADASKESETDEKESHEPAQSDAVLGAALLMEIQAKAQETQAEFDYRDDMQTAIDYVEATETKVEKTPAPIETSLTLLSKPQKPKPFVCTVCNRGFSRSNDLTRHALAMQHGQTPLLCSVCNKSFSRSNDLKRHALDTQHVQTDEESNARQSGHTSSPAQQLKESLHNIYTGRKVLLKDLDYPKECQFDPGLKDFIFDAYLKTVTVLVTIWSNYDGCTKQFFRDDTRIQDCGKVYLAPKQRSYLDDLDGSRAVEMKNVVLNIGTAFRTFFRVSIRHDGSEFLINGKRLLESGLNTPHDELEQVVLNTMKAIAGYRTWVGKAGLRLTDLDEIAKCFVRLQ